MVIVSLCKWFLTFWEVLLCHSASVSWHFEVWFCVVCKQFLTFWDVILCYCASVSWHFEVWFCVTVQAIPDILRCDSVLLCKQFLTSWDVILCYYAGGSWHFEMCHCVTVLAALSGFWCSENCRLHCQGKQCLTLMMKVSGTFRMSETTRPMTQHHIPEDKHPHGNVPLSSI